jgi:hypothetical protein
LAAYMDFTRQTDNKPNLHMIYASSATIAHALVRLLRRMGSCDCRIRDNRLVVRAHRMPRRSEEKLPLPCPLGYFSAMLLL